MPKELFNQTLIEDPNLPEDDDRIGLGQPSVSGGKNIKWGWFKQIIQGLASVFDWIDFTPQAIPPAHIEGRQFYSEVEHTQVIFNDIPDVSLNVGEELWARLLNSTGDSLLNGKVGYVSGVTGLEINCDLAIASDLNQSIRTLGVFTNDISNGNRGYITRFGAVRGMDTSSWAVNDPLYLSATTAGELTNVKPKAPNYSVRIAIVIVSDAVEGVIGVDTLAFNGSDTGVNIEGTLNGVVIETPKVDFYESGGDVYVEVRNENDLTKNLNFMIDGVRYQLDTLTGGGPNGGAFAQLTPGADADTLFENFIYVWLNGGPPELRVSTRSTSDANAPIGLASMFNVTRTLTEGVYKFRRFNDAPDNGEDDGFNRWIADAVRDKLGTTYTSGIDSTVIVNSTPSVTIATTAGVAMQAHTGSFSLQDGTQYWVYNDNTNTATYAPVSDLASIVETALGATLAVNGAYYRLPVYGMQNSESGGVLSSPDKLLVTRPLGSYSSAAEALTDAANFDVKPNDIITEGVLFKLYTIVIGRTGGGGATWTEIATLDERTRLIGGTGGGGAQGGAGTDDKVRITANDTTNSYLDDKITPGDEFTKEITNPGANETLTTKFKGWIYNVARTFKAIFNIESLTADRTYTLQDKSYTIADNADVSQNTSDITDLQTDKADKSNVLELDNSTPFTPNADYEPATYKFVNDLLALLTYLGLSDTPGIRLSNKFLKSNAGATAEVYSSMTEDANGNITVTTTGGLTFTVNGENDTVEVISTGGLEFSVDGLNDLAYINTFGGAKLEVNGSATDSLILESANGEKIEIDGSTGKITNTGDTDVTGRFQSTKQAHGGSDLQSFSASKTFDNVNGNNHKMVVTGDTTINLTDSGNLSVLRPGGYYISLEIDSGTSPVIAIGASVGVKSNESADLNNSDNVINFITVVVDADGFVGYAITTFN